MTPCAKTGAPVSAKTNDNPMILNMFSSRWPPFQQQPIDLDLTAFGGRNVMA
jgi:hypothetical protein